MATMKTKQVSFNLDNPKERELYNRCDKLSNFSGFAKKVLTDRLIVNDIKVEVGRSQSTRRPPQ